MDIQQAKEYIAKRVAKELKDGDVVNLGIGVPTLVSNYIPEGVEVTLHSENGFVGLGPAPEKGKEDKDLINAGIQPATILSGAAFFNSAFSFGLVRGGHIDVTVLGAFQVDEKGNLANWMVPGKLVTGMGGAMDLVVGAKKVIIAMTHTQKGKHKIVKECTLPLTAVGQVDLIVTDMGVIEVTDKGLVLKEIAPEVTVEDVIEATGSNLIISDDLKNF